MQINILHVYHYLFPFSIKFRRNCSCYVNPSEFYPVSFGSNLNCLVFFSIIFFRCTYQVFLCQISVEL